MVVGTTAATFIPAQMGSFQLTPTSTLAQDDSSLQHNDITIFLILKSLVYL